MSQPARPEYVLLTAPSSNRVYAGQAPRLASAELAAFGATGSGPALRDPTPVQLGGVPYLRFTTGAPLSERDLSMLARAAGGYALFAVEGELLRPLTLAPDWHYDDDLVTIPKYAGKTNEQFTQLLLNLTVLGAGRALDSRLVVLDPLCGRGTTLNHALRYGYHAIGIELDSGHFDAYVAFLRTWLRRKRLKHTVELHPVRQHGARVARRLAVTVAASKEQFKAGDTQQLTVYHGDTVAARGFLRAGCCDVIVTDLPYGIAHRSRTGNSGTSRSPAELLAAAVPVWTELLRRGGALGVSFNTHVAPRDEVAKVLAGAGLTVLPQPDFSHWVDQGITRDLLVARA